MTWQSDYGNFADIDMYQYRNGVAVSDKPFTVFNDNKYNNLPKIRMTGDGGWIVAAIDNDGDMKIGIVDVDNDFTSNLYLQSSLSLSVCKLKNPCLNPEYNNFDIWVDNLGTIRVFFMILMILMEINLLLMLFMTKIKKNFLISCLILMVCMIQQCMKMKIVLL